MGQDQSLLCIYGDVKIDGRACRASQPQVSQDLNQKLTIATKIVQDGLKTSYNDQTKEGRCGGIVPG